MKSIRDIINLEPKCCEFEGLPFKLRRPSAADLIDALAYARDNPDATLAWMCWRHCLDNEGNLLFATIDAAMNADADFIVRVGKMAEAMYGEGRD